MTKCTRCHERIPAKRLAAVPGATRCTSCQARYDDYVKPPDSVMAVMGEGDVDILVSERSE